MINKSGNRYTGAWETVGIRKALIRVLEGHEDDTAGEGGSVSAVLQSVSIPWIYDG